MANNAFMNLDTSELQAARKARLEEYRQRLIAYDANPVPRSPDLVEPADSDVNADGYTWNSLTGRWENEGGGGEIDVDGVLVSDNNLSDVTDAVVAAENLGIFAVGTLSNPRVLAPVKWYWGTINEVIIGTENEYYQDGVISAVDDEDGDPLNGAIPDPTDEVFTNETIVPIGSTENVAIGVQVGDRVFWDERSNYGRQGVYVVTDVGDGSNPWSLTRADDQPESEILEAFVVQVEGTPMVIRTTVLGSDPEFVAPTLSFGNGSVATGDGAIATGEQSLVFGQSSEAWAEGAVVIGSQSQAVESNSIAIGSNVFNGTENSVEIGNAIVHNYISFGTFDSGQYTIPNHGWATMTLGGDTEFVGQAEIEGSTVTICIVGDDEPWDITFQEDWIFLGETPTSLAANKIAVLSVAHFASGRNVAAYAVQP